MAAKFVLRRKKPQAAQVDAVFVFSTAVADFSAVVGRVGIDFGVEDLTLEAAEVLLIVALLTATVGFVTKVDFGAVLDVTAVVDLAAVADG